RPSRPRPTRRGGTPTPAPRRIDHCLDACRIREVRRRLLGTLSKGYRQRVGLADALINDPPILILDEPTDGLDPGQKAETLTMLKELGRNHTIMLSSHMLSEVETTVQRVIILRRGLVGLARRLSEPEADPALVGEGRGPGDQVTGVLKGPDGVSHVSHENLGDGVAAFEVRTHKFADLRELLSQRLAKNGWPLRRLDLRRRRLQDRWNEINNMDEALLGAPAPGPGAVTSDRTRTAPAGR